MTSVRRIALAIAVLALPCAILAEEVQTVEAGSFSGPDRAFLVIEDETKLRRIHRDVHAHTSLPPPLPMFDFEHDLALLAFMGQRSTAGYAIEFDSPAQVRGGVAYVRVVEQTPPPGAALATVITSPYVMARLRRGEFGAVKFIDSEDVPLAHVDLEGGSVSD